MSKNSWLSNHLSTIVIVVLALAIRLYGATTPAQYYDIGTFEAWSRSFWVHGPHQFFTSVWSDYMPLPILTFAPISWLADLLHAPFGLIFKLVHLFIELILIYFIAKSSRFSISLLVCLLLSPALISDTSFWGQVDTIPALLALLSLTTMSPLLFGLSVAYKPIMILIAPVLWIKDLKEGKAWWRFPLFSSLIFLSTAIPFVQNPGQIFMHLLTRALNQSNTYPYLTINAFNLWSLIPDMSWISDSSSVFSLSGRTLGLFVFAFMSYLTLNSWRKAKFSPKFAARVAATILICFYAFTTRMHERHLLFGLPLLTLAAISETWLFIPLSLLTLTFTLNLYGAYYWVVHAQTWPFSPSVISLISWVVVLTSLSLSLVWDWPSFLKSLIAKLKSNKLLILILIISAFLRLYNLSYPPVYIFDEVYHAFTAREYLHNHIEAWEWWTKPPKDVAYEWTHPPVAKYGMVAGMLLFGENSFGWRIGSAVFGILSILGLYLFICALVHRRDIALLSAFLVSIEGLHIAQSRIGMNDMYMLTFLIWSLYLSVKSRWKGVSILFGLSLASKWSAVYGLVPLTLIYFHDQVLPFLNLKSSILNLFKVIRLLLIVLAVYVLTFAPFILAGHTWAQWWELHRQMWYYHTHLVATHAYQSVPLQWIFDVRPVWYYVKYLGDNISNIYVLGNPFILWLGLVVLTLQLKKVLKFPYFILYTLYLIFTLPWIFSPRIMFFYHYLPSSVFLCVILASYLSSIPARPRNILLVCCLVSLLVIAPMLYGFPMSHLFWDTLFTIFPSWK